MLKSLSIINYTLIKSLEIDFDDGFSVITGETGAGKSIIIGALSLILGSRADTSVIRDRAKKCIIEGVFNTSKLPLHKFFEDNDIDYDEQTIIRREILPSGKSRAFINDTPVNLGLLSYVGNELVNVHSQHETLELSNSSFQLNVLDDFVNKPRILQEYQVVFRNYNTLSTKLDELIKKNNKALKDEDYFNYQFDELNNASLDKKVVEDLEERSKFLEHAEEIKLALSESEAILNNEDTSVIDGLQNVERLLDSIKPYLLNAKDLVDRLNSVTIELKDILLEIESLAGDDDFDPDELQLVNDKLNVVYSLIQKHRVQTVDELIDIRDEYERKLLNISSLDEDIEKHKKELLKVENELDSKAILLHDSRVNGVAKFSKAITNVLTELGMKGASFVVEIERLPKYSITGVDKVLFMFNANLGTPVGEISKIASGGELSRLMLAIKSLISKKQMLPTVIFDEIDSGVSGDIAGKVGVILKKMALNHQVISISHLPQIASKAHHHYKVFKQVEDNATISVINRLTDEDRVEELAKMLSSEKVTSKALDVARELMSN